MDKKRGLANVAVSMIFKVVILIVTVLARRYMIRYIGNDVNGLNSLYISLLDFLSVAELGVGSAITFCMYKPIVEGDNKKVSALYHLFTKLYLIIGGIILVCGCILMPFLKILAKDYQTVDVNLYLTFGIMLASVVISYMFSAKTALINAYKNNYITTTVFSIGQILQCGLQIIVLIFTRSFVWYLICRVISISLQWVATEVIARIKHGGIIKDRVRIDAETKKEVTKNIKAMFMHKIGGVLVNTADSIIISSFIGISILGKYSNYTTIVVAMIGVLGLCFTPLTSVIGHMFVEESREQANKYFNFFHTFNFVLGVVFFLGYYSVIDNMITVLFADGLELAKTISFVITVNYFIQFLRQAVMLFKDAAGTFYYDRWKPIFEGLLNIGLSILFVKVFPEELKVVGVIIATIITNVLICHIVEPYVLYKHTLLISPKRYYIRNYIYIVVFVAVLVALNYSMISNENQWTELFANGGISLAMSLPISFIAVMCNKDCRLYMKGILQRRKRHNNAPTDEAIDGAAEVETTVDASDIPGVSVAEDPKSTEATVRTEEEHTEENGSVI